MMAPYVWVNPANTRQKYESMNPSDPGVPAGYVPANSDGSIIPPQQDFQGSASGGWPPYGDLRDLGTRQVADPNRKFT